MTRLLNNVIQSHRKIKEQKALPMQIIQTKHYPESKQIECLHERKIC